jgi:23S rRNA (guanosine2251-2'-O)-methyltransferase
VHTILLATGRGEEELAQLLPEWCGAVGAAGCIPPVRRMEPFELTARLSTSEHQGIAAEVDPYSYVEEAEILAGRTLLVVLDEVQDPHNLGAIIRTAEGAGAGVVIPRHRAAEVTAAVVKASAGATEHAAVAVVRNLADFLEEAKKAGFWVYGTAAGAASGYADQDYKYPTCFVLGSEGQGLGRRVESLCDVMVGLPLRGQVESLNVSVSAGILLYEALRQRGCGGPDRPAEPGAARP